MKQSKLIISCEGVALLDVEEKAWMKCETRSVDLFMIHGVEVGRGTIDC